MHTGPPQLQLRKSHTFEEIHAVSPVYVLCMQPLGPMCPRLEPCASQVLKSHPDNFKLDYALSREQKNKDGGKMYIQDKVGEYSDEVFTRMDNVRPPHVHIAPHIHIGL